MILTIASVKDTGEDEGSEGAVAIEEISVSARSEAEREQNVQEHAVNPIKIEMLLDGSPWPSVKVLRRHPEGAIV